MVDHENKNVTKNILSLFKENISAFSQKLI